MCETAESIYGFESGMPSVKVSCEAGLGTKHFRSNRPLQHSLSDHDSILFDVMKRHLTMVSAFESLLTQQLHDCLVLS